VHVWDAIGNAGELERLLERTDPTHVVLATALARVGDCERDPDLARALNSELPACVARSAQARGLRAVLVSTDLVFGRVPPQGGERYTEQDPPSPAHEYGRTKAVGERRFRDGGGDLVVRLPLLYGDSGGRGAGASDQILAALARGERPALFEDEWRTPLELGNAARALAEVLTGAHTGILHLAGPRRLSRLELGLCVLVARGDSPERARERIRAARRADLGLGDRPSDVSLDASRALAFLRTPLLAPREALDGHA
jgi:dTDP-4-dehydrorhamnose reductase